MKQKIELILAFILLLIMAGYGQADEREMKPFRFGMSVVVSPNYYTQLGVDIEPTYMLIDRKLTIGLRYLGLWSLSNITSSQSFSLVSDMYFVHKKFDFFFRSVGMGIGLFRDRDSVKADGMYTTAIFANHVGFMVRAGGENRIDHTRLTLEYDYVPNTKSSQFNNSIFAIVWGFYIGGGYYNKSRRHPAHF